MRINRLKLLIGITAKKIAIHYYPDIIIIQLLERLISLINLGRSLEMPVLSQGHCGFPSFPVVD
jgi:hypothetical protein